MQWRLENQWWLDCLLTCLFRRLSKKTSKLRVTGLCEGNSPVTGEFRSQRASNAENASIWWRHHVALVKEYCATISWWLENVETFFASLVLCERKDSRHKALVIFRNKIQTRPQQRPSGALMYSFLQAWTPCWTNRPVVGNMRRYDAHVMLL